MGRADARGKILKIATARANDGIRLALLGDGALEELDRMELSGVKSFRRLGNGGIEIEFVDRIGALEWLCEHGDEEKKEAEEFLRALRG